MVKKLFKYLKGDISIWILVLTLSLISMMVVYSSTGSLAYKNAGGNTFYFLFRHSMMLLVGIVIIFITHRVPYKYFSRISQILLYISIPLLLITLLIGVKENDAIRRIEIFGFTFQTSDMAKLALTMYLARILSQAQENKEKLKKIFKKAIIAIAIVCILVIPANFSTAGLIFITSVVLLYIGRIPFKYLLGILIILVLVIGASYYIGTVKPDLWRFGTVKSRIDAFLGTGGSKEELYQTKQAKIAVVTGGLFGKGPGHSTQRNYLPHSYSDFIYAIIVEEYGIPGSFIVLLLYLILVYRAGVIIRKCPTFFGGFLAVGLSLSLVFQAFINMAVSVSIFPVTGQPLPYISMGGTSILFTSIALGCILSVSKVTQNSENNGELA